ncbi:PREDICTED: F-box/kelch-repeat protein At3g23880-like [Nicotiana attenuata]|uniref:F-box/kelch-repeat protein At3g23880-like n=1 Tax=Nicotiana attenuata TaxID=49451 RepID=UPI00090497DF|nr:PREDICTED: F-box/kelch-repeat protein At3g23880-like [Nicotiana attenuata]
MANHVPNEIIIIILSNLPVKSLLRFKCVSKPWNSWISSPKFQLSNQRRQGAISMVFKLYEERKKGYSESTAFRFINQQLTLRERKFPFVIRDNKIISGTCMFLGSCHGLILVNINEHIYLWNPATRFCTKVLELDRLDECGYCTHGGLCFDSSKNVYKVVLIMHHQTPDYGGEFVIVASLKDKIWKRVKFPYNIRSVRGGITLHGRLH